MSLSCIMIIKNGIKNGYPFLESIRSIVDIADEFLIADGYSEDETYEYLAYAAGKFSNIKLFRDHWFPSKYGECIAAMTNRLKARTACDWVYNIQADEIIHETMLPKLCHIANQSNPEYHSVAVKFLHFVGDCLHVETKPGYDLAVRLVPNTAVNFVADDGWTFRGAIDPIGVIEAPPLFHFGWIYAKDNLYKRKHQAQYIHCEQKSYQNDYAFCRKIETEFNGNPEAFWGWQRKMLAYRKIRKYEGSYPKAALHLLEKKNFSYEPDTRVLDIEIPHTHQLTETSRQALFIGSDSSHREEKTHERLIS